MRRGGFTWDRLTVASVLSFCVLVCGLSVGLVLGELRDEMHLSSIVAAAHGSTFGFGLLVLGSVGSGLVGRLGRPAAFAISIVSMVVGVMLLCLGHTWPLTLAGATLSGTGGALLVMLMPGIVADHHGEHRAAAFTAINGIPGVIGIVLSVVVGGVITSGGSWRWPYAIITLVVSASFAISVRGVRIPHGSEPPVSVLPLLRRPEVRGPWLRAVLGVLVEFSTVVWAVVYLKEVGGASSGLAVILGALWGLFLSASRMALPRLLHHAGAGSSTVAYGVAAAGALLMWAGPSLTLRAVGLSLVALGAGPLYPLAVDGLYATAGAVVDSVSLGAVAALASGVAITTGPMALGAVADVVGLRNAMLVVPALALLGVYTSWPHRPGVIAPSSNPLADSFAAGAGD